MHRVEHGRYGWYVYRGRVFVAGPMWSKANAERLADQLNQLDRHR